MADYMHKVKVRSIYERTDYLTNIDLSVPRALAMNYRFGRDAEMARHTGLPLRTDAAQYTPLALRGTLLPKRPSHG